MSIQLRASQSQIAPSLLYLRGEELRGEEDTAWHSTAPVLTLFPNALPIGALQEELMFLRPENLRLTLGQNLEQGKGNCI